MPDDTPSIGSEPTPATVPPAGDVPGQRPPSGRETPVPSAAQPPTTEPAATSEVPAAPPTAQSLPPPAPATEPTPAPAPDPAPPPPPPPATERTPAPAPAPATERTPGPAEHDPAPRRRRRVVGTLVFGVVVLVLLGAIGYVLYQRLFSDPTRDAMAGDCLADLPIVAVGEDQEVSTARVVSCDDPTATFVVEGRLDRLSEAQAGAAEICQAYEDARFIYRAVPRDGTGYVLCLRQLAE